MEGCREQLVIIKEVICMYLCAFSFLGSGRGAETDRLLAKLLGMECCLPP